MKICSYEFYHISICRFSSDLHCCETGPSDLPCHRRIYVKPSTLLSWNSFQSSLSPCLDINSLSNSLWNFTNIIVPFSSQRGGRQCCHSVLEWEIETLEAPALLSSQSLLCLPSANSGMIDSCDSWPVHMVQWNSGNELYVTRWKHIKLSNMLS